MIWKRTQQRARCHDVLCQMNDGVVLAILPDTAGDALERWLHEIQDLTSFAAIGQASFSEDGQSARQLVECAVSRMWMGQGVDADEELAPWPADADKRRPPPLPPQRSPSHSCETVRDEDIICADSLPSIPIPCPEN
jgi:hypothetical protein